MHIRNLKVTLKNFKKMELEINKNNFKNLNIIRNSLLFLNSILHTD